MSLSLKNMTIETATISQKQFITNSLGQRLELVVHSGKLYIQSHESDGTITGGELVLDPLPISVTYGSDGDTTNPVVEIEFTTDLTELTASVRDDIIAYYQGLYPDATIVLTTAPGSLKILIDLQFTAGYDTSTVVATASEEGKRSEIATLTGATVSVSKAAVATNKQVAATVKSFTFTPPASGDAPSVTSTVTKPSGNYTYPWTFAADFTTGITYFTTREGDTCVFRRLTDGTIEVVDTISSTYEVHMSFYEEGSLYVLYQPDNQHCAMKRYVNGQGPAQDIFNCNGWIGGMSQRCLLFKGKWWYGQNGGLHAKDMSTWTSTWNDADMANYDVSLSNPPGFDTSNGFINNATSDDCIQIFTMATIGGTDYIYWEVQSGSHPTRSAYIYRCLLADSSNPELMWNLGYMYNESYAYVGHPNSGYSTGPRPTEGIGTSYLNFGGLALGHKIYVTTNGLYKCSEFGVDHWANIANPSSGVAPRTEAIPWMTPHMWNATPYLPRELSSDVMFLALSETKLILCFGQASSWGALDTVKYLEWPLFGEASVDSIVTVGPYNQAYYKLSTQPDSAYALFTGTDDILATPADVAFFSIDIKLLSPDGTELNKTTITHDSRPVLMNHWNFNDTYVDLLTDAEFEMSGAGSATFVASGANKAIKMHSGGTTYLTFASGKRPVVSWTTEATFAFWVKMPADEEIGENPGGCRPGLSIASFRLPDGSDSTGVPYHPDAYIYDGQYGGTPKSAFEFMAKRDGPAWNAPAWTWKIGAILWGTEWTSWDSAEWSWISGYDGTLFQQPTSVVSTFKHGENSKLYINGALVIEQTPTLTDVYPTGTTWRGEAAYDWQGGHLMDAQIYKKSMSASEVLSWHNNHPDKPT